MSPNRQARSGRIDGTRVAAALALGAGALMLWLRLNPLHILHPDSPGYLFQARALATLEGYRDIDRPGAPLHTLRPPGLPALLAPLALVAPLDPVPAKLLVGLGGLLGACVLDRLVRRVAGGRAALAVLLVTLTSPYWLVFSSEVLAEAPYLLLVLVVMGLLDGAAGEPRGGRTRRVWLLGASLALLCLLRSIGVTLAVALGCLALADRRRRGWLGPALAALAVAGLWAARNRLVGGFSYLGAATADMATWGFLGTLLNATLGAFYGVEQLVGVLLPGVLPGSPWYWVVMAQGHRIAPGPAAPYLLVALVVLGLAAGGMLRGPRASGPVMFLHLVLTLGLLSLWPYRDARFYWPLVPVLLVYVPDGAGLLAARWEVAGRARRAGALAAAALVSALVGWQLLNSLGILDASLAWRRDRERFEREAEPPYYYCDWAEAGRWLRARARPEDRVLTRHNALGLTARRLQELVPFEALAPRALHQELQAQGARWLAVPSTRISVFTWSLLAEDPAYRFEPRYEGHGVVVLAVEPNREGRVSAGGPDRDQVEARRAGLARHPDRTDLALRLANELSRRGRPREALPILEGLIARKVRSVQVHETLGRTLAQLGDRDGAMRELRRALAFAGVDERAALLLALRQVREGGLAERREPGAPGPQDPSPACRQARAAREALQMGLALAATGRAQGREAELPCLLRERGLLADLQGDREAAMAALARAAEGGDAEAREAVLRLDYEAAAEGGQELDAASTLRLAELQDAAGLPGRALATLEAARSRGGAPAEVLLALGRLERRFGLFREAEGSFHEAARAGAPEAAAEAAEMAALRAGSPLAP